MVRAWAFAAACLLVSPVAYAQAIIRPGDFAAVAAGGATLMVNDQPAAELPENTWFEAARSAGSWTAGHAYVGGARKSGWVLTAKLAPESLERQAQAAAAWEKRGARVDRDARGAVLTIDAADKQASDADLGSIASFPRLEELSLGGSRVTSAGLAKLAGLPSLKRLFLDGLPLVDDDLKPLSPLRRLESLSLASTKIGDRGLAHLSGLTSLQVLNLTNCEITDEGLAHLAFLVNMETLALKNTKVRGPGLLHLRGMTPLNVLNLSHCQIQGEYLMFLGGMDNLRILHVADCHIEQKYIDQLERDSVSLAVFD